MVIDISHTRSILFAAQIQNRSHNIWIANFTDNTEYNTSGQVNLGVERNFNIILEGTNQIIEVPVQKKDLRCYKEEIECTSTKLLYYFTFKKMIQNRYQVYVENWKTTQEKATKGDFKWGNDCVHPYLEQKARPLSNTCRHILTKMTRDEKWDKHYCSFLYIFCFKDPITADSSPLTITTKEGYRIDLNAREVKYDIGESYNGYLTGYRISSILQEESKIVTIRQLEEDVNETKDGAVFKVFIHGEPYTAIRDSSMNYLQVQSSNRQLCEQMKHEEDLSSAGKFPQETMVGGAYNRRCGRSRA
ncbi:hypothetical protein JTB14_019746 [Gonioctena quinquepunctata]|nr:hypothetical protein JTB14_019746 [Gonioctena quinquepunctata]